MALVTTPCPIEAGRARIEELDRELVRLIARRVALVMIVNAAKCARGLEVHDPEREKFLVRKICPIPGPEQRCYREVIRVCREHAKAPVSDSFDGGSPEDAG